MDIFSEKGRNHGFCYHNKSWPVSFVVKEWPASQMMRRKECTRWRIFIFFKTSVKGSSMKVWTIENIKKSMLVLSVRRKMILSWILFMCSILSSRRNRSQCHIACEELTCDLNVSSCLVPRNSCSHHAVFLSGKTLDKVVKQIIVFL